MNDGGTVDVIAMMAASPTARGHGQWSGLLPAMKCSSTLAQAASMAML